MDQYPSIPSSLSSRAFSQAFSTKMFEKIRKAHPRRSGKNQESLFKTFSKVPLHWKPPSSLQKYSQHLSSIFLQTNFLTRSFSYSSRFSSFFRHSAGREMAVRIFITDISRSKIERGRRFLMHRSLTIRNRKWDTNERNVARFLPRKKGKR